MSFFGFLAVVLGPLMKLLYNFINNYAVTMIVFTVLIRLCMMPLMIYQQKSMAKMSVFQPMMNEIQQKYKNNQQKQQEEMMKLQTEYGFNPMAGCAPMLLNMVILFGIIEVVYRPVHYILGIPTDAIKTACEGAGISANSVAMQTNLIQAIHNGTATLESTGLTQEQFDSIYNFNTTFLGLDVCSIAGLAISPLVIFPIIAGITMIASYIITQKVSGTSNQMQGSMKVTMWLMNIWFIYYCFTAPVGFSLYYATSNLLQIVQSFISYKIYSPEKFKAEYEAELAAKKAAKKQKTTVTVEENGKKVEKQVTLKESEKLRLEQARKLDEEKYAGERTERLSPEELSAETKRLTEQAKKKKKKLF